MSASDARGQSNAPGQKLALIKAEPSEGLPARTENEQWRQTPVALRQNLEAQRTRQDLSVYQAHIRQLSLAVDREMVTDTTKQNDGRSLQYVGVKRASAEDSQASFAGTEYVFTKCSRITSKRTSN